MACFVYPLFTPSTASLNPSPIKLMANTATKIKIPAGTHLHGSAVNTRIDWAPDKMFPQLGLGGCTPTPKKLKEASVRIAVAIPKVALTKIGEMTFGKI